MNVNTGNDIESKTLKHLLNKKVLDRKLVKACAPLFGMVALVILFSILSKDFFTINNFRAIAWQMAVLLIVSVGITFVILMGSIDLSVEGIMAISSVVISLLVANSKNSNNLGLWAIPIAIAIGTLFGFANGVIHTKAKIPSFMVTLGMSSIASGLSIVLYGGNPIIIKDSGFRFLAMGSFMGVPIIFIIAMVILLFGFFLQKYTRFGRYIYAIGGGEDIVRLSGINIEKYKIWCFTLAGFCIALAGVLNTARIGQGTALAGQGSLFSAITAVVVGGTALTGGVGGVLNTLIGTLIVTILSNGMILLAVNPYVQVAIQGIIIIAAVALTIDHSKINIMK